jgi:hypothetical protein
VLFIIISSLYVCPLAEKMTMNTQLVVIFFFGRLCFTTEKMMMNAVCHHLLIFLVTFCLQQTSTMKSYVFVIIIFCVYLIIKKITISASLSSFFL